MRKAIVSGANGFIGTALVKALSQEGCHVIAILHNATENATEYEEIAHLQNVEIVYCELCEFLKLPQYIAARGFDVFYHLAWIGSAGPLREDSKIQLSNVSYTCDAVQACTVLGCKRFVFASSIMEFEVIQLMNTEKSPSLNTFYSTAKITAHYMAKAQTVANSMIFNAAIISNVYGVGERSPRLINTSIKKMLRGERVSFSPGEQLYDFIYITDAANAFAAIGEAGHPQKDYYIGNIVPRPLKEFLLEMRDTVAPDLKIGLGDYPFNGVSLTYHEFDTTALQKDFGFEPVVSFDVGIAHTAKWLTKNEGNI